MMIGCNKIEEYFDNLRNNSWYVLERNIIDSNGYDGKSMIITKCFATEDYSNETQFYFTIRVMKLKKGYLYLLDEYDYFSSEDEVIEELKNMGIK